MHPFHSWYDSCRMLEMRPMPVEPKAGHGMAVMGEETVYLSHLPMFAMPVHAFQVLLEVTLDNEAGNAHKVYVEDRRQTGTDLYTLDPEPFRISDLVTPAGQPALTSFDGTLYRGHFERGGTAIVDPVRVDVRRVVHFRHLDEQDPRPPVLTYLAFGKGGELFLAHRIVTPPDFDQHLQVGNVRSVSGVSLTDELLAKGPRLAILGRDDTPADRLAESQQVAAKLLDGGAGAPDAVDLRFTAKREFYFEEGELASGSGGHHGHH
ncbi:hypothetical protein ABZ924_30465 [Streptomyces sp. NPDC046876]|uniref:hypothetical protein n=1 Tax=Streptomyces sp. NPDC046876 TaxID=3155616 RepID=UPI003400A633